MKLEEFGVGNSLEITIKFDDPEIIDVINAVLFISDLNPEYFFTFGLIIYSLILALNTDECSKELYAQILSSIPVPIRKDFMERTKMYYEK